MRFANLEQPIVNGYPWGSKDVYNSDAYSQAPDTGIVRSYDFTIARGTVAPDGFEISTLLINGQFPGVIIPKTRWWSWANIYSLQSMPIGAILSKSLYIIKYLRPRKAPPFTGMVFNSRVRNGWMASLLFQCAQLHPVAAIRIASKLTHMVLLGIIHIILASIPEVFGAL